MGVAAQALSEVTGEVLAAQRFWRAKRAGATTAQALAGLGHDRAETVAARWSQCIESDAWLARDRALAGVPQALAGLRAQGTRLIVITARTRADGAALSLEAASLRELIDELVVVDPRAAVAAKARVLRSREAVGFIGDSESDGDAAAAAAVPFAAVTTGQRSRRVLQAGGWPVSDSLRAALRSLGELERAR